MCVFPQSHLDPNNRGKKSMTLRTREERSVLVTYSLSEMTLGKLVDGDSRNYDAWIALASERAKKLDWGD